MIPAILGVIGPGFLNQVTTFFLGREEEMMHSKTRCEPAERYNTTPWEVALLVLANATTLQNGVLPPDLLKCKAAIAVQGGSQ